ncbi:MAG: hypothetical protein A2849_01695 [Candidatus Taylorbacteria bacterium RIFCSPHIGHO2_01_FULL_51_15]|uniref:Uncharacterized protein n=1 Tax=Candidatus Taylorbacteria bacterium RIFCSPHIGHO2_01_FULL_51_15 TaxID=1802304 RepID=A0A1G2MDA0_9BACT|nr:MAG: hypothetical protein A2849_01695 [Candidatus Taylorbacteria bacterium RIFCSPHIGHO2_01_FULL_51_15]
MEPENTQEQQQQVGGKSKTGVYIVVGIVVLLVIGWLVKGVMFRSVTGVDVDRNLGGATTYSNEEGSVTVGGNKLPDNWPSDAPAYKNATIQYSGTSNPQTGEAGAAVVFTTTDSVETVVRFYEKELAANGWTVEQTAAIGGSTVIAAKKDTRSLGLYVVDSGNGEVSVTLGISMP